MKIFLTRITLCFLLIVVMPIADSALYAQTTTFRQQAWRYGLHAGLQLNSAGLGWQQLHGTDGNFHSPEDNIDYIDGTGGGAYLGIFGEYLSSSWWGVQFRLSYDQRNAFVIDDTRLPIPAFDTKLSYLMFEPLFRVDQHLIPDLNFYVGPFVAVKLNGTYIYSPDNNEAVTEPEIDVADLNAVTYGLQGGIAYDVKVSKINEHTSMYLSPFVDWSWLINQKPSVNVPNQNSLDDIWSTISYRLGVRLSFEYKQADEEKLSIAPVADTSKVFVIMPIENTILTKNIKGYFPIHPYIFFEKGSKEIPTRYVSLSKADAQNFNEADLSDFMKGDLTVKETNVNQLMRTYYNAMNVYADRMRKNPNEELTLRGSDPQGIDGESYANKVKSYLVNNFGINADRIKIVVEAPKKPSGSIYTDPTYKDMIDDENRRVVFVFDNPDMLKPLTYTIRDESSIDNDMIFTIDKNVPFKSWDITITGENRSMYFGPFAYSSERINPAELMRFLENGKYNAQVVITEKNGKKTEENYPFRLTKERELRNASRYLMVFDYNSSDAVLSYETKIREEITPGMVQGNRVIIHGHTDIIGNEAGNQVLSQERAEQAKRIVDDELRKENKQVNVQAVGIGQSKVQYTFDNRYPEGRMYNRNIFIEINQ